MKGLGTQMTGLKTQKLGEYILANSVQKNPRLMGQKIKKKKKQTQKQKQEAVLHTDTPNPTAPNIKEAEISKF